MEPSPPVSHADFDALPELVRRHIAFLDARVAELELRLGMNSSNSSKPPSSDPPYLKRSRKHAKSKRKQGGQPGGHPKHERELVPEAELVSPPVEVKPEVCVCCGEPLTGEDMAPLRHQVAELPVVKPLLTEHQPQALGTGAAGMAKSLLSLEESLWIHLHIEGLDARNSVAERALRAAVQWRKNSFGTMSEIGARFAERMLTATATAAQRGRDFLALPQQALEGKSISLLPEPSRAVGRERLPYRGLRLEGNLDGTQRRLLADGTLALANPELPRHEMKGAQSQARTGLENQAREGEGPGPPERPPVSPCPAQKKARFFIKSILVSPSNCQGIFRMMGTRTSALAVLLCVAATASAQRPGSVSVDGWCNSGSDQAAYSAATANWEPTPWGDSAAFLIVEAQGSEIDNLRVSNTSNALNLFVGGNLQGGTTALVVAIERPGVPTVTAFAGVDGVPGFFQTEAAGPGLGGATLPPFNYLAMFRFTDPNLDTFPDIEVALLEVATGTITYSGVVSTLDGNVSAAVNFGSALGSAGISNQNVGGVTDSGAVTSPLSVNSGIELSLPLPSFYGSLGPVVPGEVWKIYPFITSFDGESGSNQSVPGNSIVGIVNDPNYQATLVGPLVEHTMLAPAPVPYFVIPTEDERVTLLNNGTSSGTYAIRNSGGVATSLTNVNTPTGFSTTFTGPVVLAPGNVTNVPITFEDNTPGVHEMDETAFVFDNTTIANEITLRNSTLTFDVDGRADESEYTSIGTSAGYHSAGANGLIEAFAAYEADQLLLAATGTLGINESMIFIVDAGFTTSLPAGAPLPGGVFTPSVFNQIAGTRLDQDADFAVRATRTGPTSVGFSLVSYLSSGSPGGEYGYIESHPSDGTPWTGVDGVFTAAFATAANLGAVTDEGFEVLIDIADLGFIPTVHTVEVTAVMTTSGAYTWTSDIIPPVYQQQPGNLGHSPDLRLLAGHQSQWVHGFQGRELDIAQGSRGLFNGSTFQMPRATEATPGTVRTFSILNDGELNLDLFSVTLTGSPALSLENFSATLPATVLPGVPLTFDVRLAGATPDTVSAQLVVMSNDVDEQVTTVTINGIVADSSADLRLAADGTDLPPGGAEDYGLLVEGLRDRTRTFTLQSIGGLPATVSAIQLAFGTQFSISNLSQSLPATLDPDEVLTFDVTLDEATIGNPLDVLSILSDDADAPVYAIDLRGQVTGSRTPLYGTVQVDGELAGDELALGYPYSSQKLLTLFGDASGALIGGGGSEINDLYITNDDEFLYLSIPGNLESNGNNLFVFIDRADDTSGASGIMPELSPPIPFWTFGNSANLNNTTMPDDLNAELMLSLNVRLLSGTIRTTLNIVDIRTLAAEQFFLGHGAPPLDVAINVPGNAIGWAVHGGNTQGVEFGSGLTARPPFTASQGMELRIPFSRIQGTGAPIQPGEIIRVFTGVTNDNGSFWSNQFLPPIATAAGNLGSSTNLSSTGLNLAVASHPILIPPEELLAGADQTVGFEVEPGSELLFEDFDITTPGTLYVVRVPNDENRAGLDRDFLIDEHWSIVAVEGFTFGSATVTFPYDESRLGGVPESSLVAVEKVEGSQHVGSFPILILDTVANTATVEITGPGFSDWYLRGASPASAPQWQIYE